jgi:hypothetical protein
MIAMRKQKEGGRHLFEAQPRLLKAGDAVRMSSSKQACRSKQRRQTKSARNWRV